MRYVLTTGRRQGAGSDAAGTLGRDSERPPELVTRTKTAGMLVRDGGDGPVPRLPCTLLFPFTLSSESLMPLLVFVMLGLAGCFWGSSLGPRVALGR